MYELHVDGRVIASSRSFRVLIKAAKKIKRGQTAYIPMAGGENLFELTRNH